MAWASIFWKLMKILISFNHNTTLKAFSRIKHYSQFSEVIWKAKQCWHINTPVPFNPTKHFFPLSNLLTVEKTRKSGWNNKLLRRDALLSCTTKQVIQENVSLKDQHDIFIFAFLTAGTLPEYFIIELFYNLKNAVNNQARRFLHSCKHMLRRWKIQLK